MHERWDVASFPQAHLVQVQTALKSILCGREMKAVEYIAPADIASPLIACLGLIQSGDSPNDISAKGVQYAGHACRCQGDQLWR